MGRQGRSGRENHVWLSKIKDAEKSSFSEKIFLVYKSTFLPGLTFTEIFKTYPCEAREIGFNSLFDHINRFNLDAY